MLIVLLFQSIENGTATELVTWRMAFGSSLIRALPFSWATLTEEFERPHHPGNR